MTEAIKMGEPLGTQTNYIRVELIDDPAAIAECRLKSLRADGTTVCRRCGNATLSIAAILVIPAGGEGRWALCARCLLEMP